MGWDLPGSRPFPPPLLRVRRIYVYTHRRMAIAAEDVWLERVIPISEGFAVEEGIHELRGSVATSRGGDGGMWSLYFVVYLLCFGIYSAHHVFSSVCNPW